ncbi:MAG TPA: type I 3-dehydroquinate dehydratase [Phycisphaerales bacterium]|nr:type I 3-dehydroquinate dehydratase [Phycisphaerales bacterium]
MALVCVPIMVTSAESALATARRAKDAGADLVEFRVDGWFTGRDDTVAGATIDEVVELVSASPAPCILTCRTALEGGQYDGPEQARLTMLERAGSIAGNGHRSPSFIDIEHERYGTSTDAHRAIGIAVQRPERAGDTVTRLILSYHDFNTRPADLIRRCSAMAEEPACRVVKIAYRMRSTRDNIELLDLIGECPKPMIGLGMGSFGLMSRVLAGKFGGFLTFAALNRGAATAPGQPTVEDLLGLYRFRSIRSQTAVYGVMGWPVEHSLSPAVHNAGFEAVGHDGVYLPLPIAPEFEPLKATLLEFIDHPRLNFGGCSVTLPHKEHLVRLARQMVQDGDDRWTLDALAARCGAANTVVVVRDSLGEPVRIDVRNTDAPAAAALLAGVETRSAAILGSGGTTRALAAALSSAGWKVKIVSRVISRAQKLVDELALPGIAAADAIAVADEEIGALVNCTPVGMAGGPDPSGTPIDPGVLRNLPPRCVVADVVYNPLRTPLLMEAERQERKTISGLAMFTAQAAEQFRLWTGKAAPERLFERVARETLESRARGDG